MVWTIRELDGHTVADRLAEPDARDGGSRRYFDEAFRRAIGGAARFYQQRRPA